MAHRKTPETPFQRYLHALGDERAAQALGARRRTVKSWRLGDRLPRPTEAVRIVARSPITLADIYGEHDEKAAA